MHQDTPLLTLRGPPSSFREQTSLRRGQNGHARRGRGYADMSLLLLCDMFAKFYCLSVYGFTVEKIQEIKSCGYESQCIAALMRTFLMNACIFATSLVLLVSTPLLTSTPHGRTREIASATFSCATRRARSQLCVAPVPPQALEGVSSRMRHADS